MIRKRVQAERKRQAFQHLSRLAGEVGAKRRVRVVAPIATALLALTAHAAERPQLRPSHDVAVTYRLQTVAPDGSPASRTVQMYWTAQGTRLRLDSQSDAGYELIDYVSSQMTLILTARRVALSVPFDPHQAPGLNIPPNATITKSRADTVAGTPCIEWTIKAAQYTAGACITQDGLVLRLSSAAIAAPALEAISVSYGPQPPSLFSIPPGYRQITAPAH